MTRLFGTDGVRGKAGITVTRELAESLGWAYAQAMADRGISGRVVLGEDPRESSPLLLAGLAAGLRAGGADVINLGVVPTPAVAWRAQQGDAAGGAMVSASHNHYMDNGIKFFGADGFKLTDADEDDLERRVADAPTGLDDAGIDIDRDAVSAWVSHVATTVDVDLSGLHVVVDAANGAASEAAPNLYEALGARVTRIHCSPNGTNINDGCGSTHPEVVAKATVEAGADIGIAHDGDADRMIAVAADGSIVDGDVVLALLARERKTTGTLANNTVVTTVMTNLGFRQAMEREGIDVRITAVGDRYVLEDMRAHGLNLGGEQSGHLIQLDHATTGDGLLTAATLMAVLRAADRPLAELATIMTRLPQTLINVPVRDRALLNNAQATWAAVATAEEALEGNGRILVRASGTESKVRVMVEAQTPDLAESHAQHVADVVRDELGVSPSL